MATLLWVPSGDREAAGARTWAGERRMGEVAAITKAASYLLWRGDFSRIRDYLLDNMVWMVSDSSGIAQLPISLDGPESPAAL